MLPTTNHIEPVTLNGAASNDPDNAPWPLTFAWAQTVGTGANVSLTGATTATPKFTPGVKGIYTYSLAVNDGRDSSPTASVKITVPTLGDIDLDGDVDKNDLVKIRAARYNPANGSNDLRDINGDGKITTLDVRLAKRLCTRRECANERGEKDNEKDD